MVCICYVLNTNGSAAITSTTDSDPNFDEMHVKNRMKFLFDFGSISDLNTQVRLGWYKSTLT